MSEKLEMFVVDLGATAHMLYAPNPGRGERTTVHTLSGTCGGIYKKAAIRIRKRDGATTRLKMDAVVSSEFNLNLLSLGQLARNGWTIDLKHAALMDADLEEYPLDIVDDLYVLRSSPFEADKTITDSTTARNFQSTPLAQQAEGECVVWDCQ